MYEMTETSDQPANVLFLQNSSVVWVPVSDRLCGPQNHSGDSMLYIFHKVTEKFDSPLSIESSFYRFFAFGVMCLKNKKSLFFLCYYQAIKTETKPAAMVF